MLWPFQFVPFTLSAFSSLLDYVLLWGEYLVAVIIYPRNNFSLSSSQPAHLASSASQPGVRSASDEKLLCFLREQSNFFGLVVLISVHTLFNSGYIEYSLAFLGSFVRVPDPPNLETSLP
jgi:hypothetical protein